MNIVKHLEIIPKHAGLSTIRKTVAIHAIADRALSIKTLSIVQKLKIELSYGYKGHTSRIIKERMAIIDSNYNIYKIFYDNKRALGF